VRVATRNGAAPSSFHSPHKETSSTDPSYPAQNIHAAYRTVSSDHAEGKAIFCDQEKHARKRFEKRNRTNRY
jgi:hypothetical protein